MEEYVSAFLETADLSVITKKHVRQEYKNHIGRDLTQDERDRINDLVYCFISEFASKQKDSTAKGDSLGNKENVGKQSNSPSTTFILKGQVVDRKSLFTNKKDKEEKKHQGSTKDIPRGQQNGASQNRTAQNGASDVERSPQQNSSRKKKKDSLKLSDVVSSVLDSDSSEDGGGSGPDSDVEMETLTAPQLKKALEQLKEARQKKIQLSHEKKLKFAESRKGDAKNPAVKRLPIQGSRVDMVKQMARTAPSSSDSETSCTSAFSRNADTISLISLTSLSEGNEEADLTAGVVGKKAEKSRINLDKLTDGKSDTVKRDRTSEKTDQGGELESNLDDLISTEHSRVGKGKIKRKEISDDSDGSNQPDVKKKKSADSERETMSDNEKIQKEMANDSDGSVGMSDRSPLKDMSQDSNMDSDLSKTVTPVRRTSRIRKPKPCSCGDVNCLSPLVKKSRNVKNKASNSSPGAANHDSKDVGDESDVSSGDVPLAKLRHTARTTVSDSDSSIDIPLAQMRKQYRDEKLKKEQSDSESSDIEEPVKKKKVRGKKVKKEVDYDSDESVDSKPVMKKKRKKQSVKQSDSDESTGDTPLIKKFGMKKKGKESISDKSATQKSSIKDKPKQEQDSDVGGTCDTPVVKKKGTHSKKSNYDSDDESTGDTPLIKKKSRSKNVDVSDTDKSVGSTPLINKKSRSKNVEGSDTDESTGDTPLIKKKFISRSKNIGGTDTDKSVGSTPLVKKKFISRSKNIGGTDTDKNVGSTPLVKKKSTSKHIDMSDTDESTGDTPLIKKKFISRSKNIDMSDTDRNVGSTPVVKKKATTKVRQLGDSDSDGERRQRRAGGSDSEPSRSRRDSPSSLSARSSSENESPVKKTPASPKQVSDADISDESEDIPLVKINKKQESSDSDEDEPLSKTKSKLAVHSDQVKAPNKKSDHEDSIHLVRLRKICKASGVVYWNNADYKESTSENEKISALKSLLGKAGMQGQPSLKKAEELKLKKEASNLSSNLGPHWSQDHISGRGKRSSSSIFSKRQPSPKTSPQKPQTKLFAELKGIVDSEGSDSD